jgi:hypothetical protein
VLHDDERTFVAIAYLVDCADVGMREDRRVLGLADQTTSRGFVGSVTENDLDGHLAAKHGVPGTIHFAHPASGDEFRNLVEA